MYYFEYTLFSFNEFCSEASETPVHQIINSREENCYHVEKNDKALLIFPDDLWHLDSTRVLIITGDSNGKLIVSNTTEGVVADCTARNCFVFGK